MDHTAKKHLAVITAFPGFFGLIILICLCNGCVKKEYRMKKEDVDKDDEYKRLKDGE